MRIGTLKQTQRNEISFKEWVRKFWSGEEVELKIIRIFLPYMYNNFTLIMQDEVNSLTVKRTLSAETGKQLIKHFKLSTKSIVKGVLFLKIDKDGNQDIIFKNAQELGYEFKNNCFVLVKQEEEEDLPF